MTTLIYARPLTEECKMQSDSMQLSTPGHIRDVTKQAATQESLVESLRCSKCTLIFKSKVYLFDHLNKVHCLDVDAALREAGLKYAGTNKANITRTNSRSAGRSFKCNNCDFKNCSWFVLNEHEKQCQKTEDLDMTGTEIVSENPETKITVFSTKQHNGAPETGETSSVLSAMSTSETQCMLALSKDLKTYKRPSQTITVDFAASSGSNGKSHVKLADDPQESPVLHEIPSSSSSNSSGVFNVAAKTGIDMTTNGSHIFLHNHLVISDLRSQKPNEQLREAVQNNAGKRTSKESPQACPAKKVKSGEETTLPENENKNTQPSCNTEFSFEVSDDDEKGDNLRNTEPQRPNVYFCKHCDYSNVDFRHVCSHYQNDHPYVKYRAIYIISSNDQSATFRCLECPIEFLSTVDLKWHYTEKHPEAPDIFKMRSSEFNLVYKCFECPFTTNASNALRQHYEKKHPLHQVDNSLLFCRYTVTQCQEGSSLKMQEKMVSPLRSGEISPEKANAPFEKVQNTPSPKHATSKGLDTVLLKCNNCDFVHKSVVVMHVHYQKNHPNEAITIDKIRQLTFGTAHTTMQVTPKKESPKKATDEQKSPEKFSLSMPEAKPEMSKYHSESAQSKKMQVVKVKRKRKMSSTKTPEEMTPRMDGLSSSTDDMFYCPFCDYSNPKIRSVVNHCCSKHGMERRINQEDIIQYSAEEHKRKLDSRASKKVKIHSRREVGCEENSASVDISLKGFSPYANADKLFYCHECNVGNPTLIGILSHQLQTHKWRNTDRERVLEYTALIRDEIEKSKLDPKGSSSSTRLPLPLMNEGDESRLFCHICNYRRSSMNLVLRHCYRNHRGFSDFAANIKQYTSVVLKEVVEPYLKTAVNQQMNQESLAKTESKKKKAKKLAKSSSSVPPSTTDSNQPSQRTLQCCKCKYNTEYVFLLKKHMRKTHNSKRSVTDILKMCFRQGNLQSGYHCEWCVFSHQEAEVVHAHYQEQHPRHLSSLAYVSAELYVGPNTQKKNVKLNSTAHVDGSVAAQRAKDNDGEMFSCSACSFKSCSKSSLAHHCQAVHSLSVKEDGSDLQDDKKAGVNSEVEDLNDMPGLFESFQVPLEDADETRSACTLFKCPSCPASFNSQRGLNVHQGIKHIGFVIEEEQDKRQVQIQKRVHVFKCPHCPYVNTSYQGVLTHCQMRHPALPSRVDSLHVDVTQLHNHDDYMKKKDSSETLKLSGYMCKTCQKICANQDKLNRHCEQDHNEDLSGSVSNTLRAAPKPSVVSKKLLIKASSAQRVVCQHCSFSCRTKIGLSHHVRIRHRNVVSKEFVYKCALCPHFYFNKKRLGCHYAKKHGKSAFMKYYVPVYKKVLKKPMAPSQDSPSAQQSQNTAAEDGKKLIYRCPDCPYVNRSYHGTLTHCQMKHPALVVRANELEIGEILVGNIVGCSTGRGSYERGYECKTCQQIHMSLKKLKVHCQKVHGDAAVSELRTNTDRENKLINSSQACIIEATPSSSPPGESQSSLESAKRKTLYKCQICAYSASFRGYLRCHYKKTHKLDALSTYKLLERYNKRKYNPLSQSADSEKLANLKCKKCPDLTFDSTQSLIDHYSTFHRLKIQSDFTVISSGVKYNSTGLYQCAHCMTRLNGTKKLCYHLDRHKEKAMQLAEAAQKKPPLVCATTSDPKSLQLCRQDKVPTFESVDELTEWNVTSLESVSQPSSPQLSPSKVSICEPEVEAKEDDGYACVQCKRTFMSLKGLRSHERSHAATAAIKKLNSLPTSELKHNINRYVVHKSGTLKRFLCGCCSYRTNLLGLWRSHFLKNHQDVIQKDNSEIKCIDEITETADEEISESEKIKVLPEFDEEAEESEESVYSEPPDVQRQLNHYTLMAQSNASSDNAQQLPESSLLYCEICNFKTEHLSSIRRHYLNRHGKKILRCKDCGFFTGLRRTLEMHMERGHHMFQSEPAHQKDLRCPFCLYQTKNKNNMIDHIVLHREERVVPIEVRRPKLSRYLEGIVFRCHKCTFTSGSAENLRLHMMRHDDIKPYKCRLCYFDCSHLSGLEAHLSDKHQVLRNHELVGQVSLEQLEVRTGKRPEKDEQHSTDGEDVASAPDSEVSQDKTLTQYTTGEKIIPHINEANEKQESDGNKEISTRDSVFDTRCGSPKSYSAIKRHEKDPQTQAGNAASLYSARGESSVEQKAGERSSANVQHEYCSHPKREDLSKAQTELGDKQNEKPGEGSSAYVKRGDTAESHKLHLKTFQQKLLNIEAKVEDDILQHISLMDEDDTIKTHNRPSQERTVKLEQRSGSKGLDEDPSDNLLQDKNDVSFDRYSKSQVNTNSLSTSAKMNSAQANNTRPQEGFRFERHLLTLSPIYPQLKLNHKESFSISFTNYKNEQEKTQKTIEEAPERDGDMPVLENECLKKELSALENCKEKEEAVHLEQKQDREDEMIPKDHSTQCSDQDDPHLNKGVFKATNGAPEILHPSCTEEKRFTCKFCGRSLTTMSELDFHVMRHGL